MYGKAAKEFSKKLSKAHHEIFSGIIDQLATEVKGRKKMQSNDFELSLVENSLNFRLLHLVFFNESLSENVKKRLRKERKEVIFKIVSKLCSLDKLNIDKKRLNNFFNFNTKEGGWPIQFGLEEDRKEIRFKVYLSVNGEKINLKKYCRLLDIDYEKIKNLAHKKIDTLAIDFMDDRKVRFKFYPLEGESKGFLVRLCPETGKVSVKKWVRLEKPISLESEKSMNFIKLPSVIKKIIMDNKLHLTYFCQELGVRSIYVR